LRKPKEEKEHKEDDEVAAPKIIRIEVVASLEIVFSRHYVTSKMSAV